ncbi:tyrosine-type recombinase/integrase [Candidatus Bathyarchaeota archaeon]|nr:tyrosine-type recombinase/integrase [Candidatus Bathyarchaeota archaeon]
MAKPPRDSDELYGFSRKLDRLLEKARPIFREFADYLGRQRLGLARRLKHVENVCRFERRFLVDRQVERVSSKEFKQAFSKILNDKGLDNDTKKLYRVSLKKFYEFLLAEREEKSGEWEKILEFLKNTKIRETEPKIEPLSDEEFQRLYEACNDLQMRAILSIARECGPRAGELLTCRVGGVRLHDDYAEIMVSGKTKQGPLLIISSYGDLINHLNHHPLRNDPSAPLWYIMRNGMLKPLTYGALSARLKRIAKRAGIKRRIWLHLFRHTAATEKARFLTDREMCQYFRWSSRSSMPSKYAHLAQRDVKPKILSYYAGKQVQEPKSITCWRCNQPIPPGVRYCPRCGAPINQDEVVRTAVRVNELESMLQRLERKFDLLVNSLIKQALKDGDIKMIIELDEDVSEITPEELAEILKKKDHVPDLLVMKKNGEISIEDREEIIRSSAKPYLYKAYVFGDKIILEPL